MSHPSPEQERTILAPDQPATERLAGHIGQYLAAGMVIHLIGDLGAGKTTFCRALIRSLGYNGRVKSPTFTLVEPYNLSLFDLYHFDFYRFSSENEIRDAGFEEQLDSDAVALVEWPERAGKLLGSPDLCVCLALADDVDARQIRLQAFSTPGSRCLTGLPEA